jgi:hypothetical protein
MSAVSESRPPLHAPPEGVRQEDDAIPGRRVLVIAAVAVVVALAGVAGSTLLLRAETGGVRAAPESTPRPAPGLRRIANVEQTDILTSRDGLDLRDRQRGELSRATWVDRDGGIATLPIDQAMDLVIRAEAQRR